MPKRIDEGYGRSIVMEAAGETLKSMFNTGLLFFEAAAIGMVVVKSKSWNMLPFGIAMLLITFFGSIAVKMIGADMRLYLLGTFLVNFGFMSQSFSGGSTGMAGLMTKLCIAFVLFFISGFLMYFGDQILMSIEVHLIVQVILLILLALLGKETTSDYGQGATIAIDFKFVTILPFEVIKVSFLFVLAYLICGPRENRLKIFGREVPKKAEVWLILGYTGGLISVMGLCREMGSPFMIFVICAVMMTVFYPDRKVVLILWLAVIAAAVAGSTFMVQYGGALWEKIKNAEKLMEPEWARAGAEIVELDKLQKFCLKIYFRFASCIHPEEWLYNIKSLNNYNPGSHGVAINEAITAGGWLGPASGRYITPFGEQTNDLIFTKFVQSMGAPFGILLIGLYGWFLYCIAGISRQEKDVYWKAVCIGILALIGFEAVYNIGFACGMLPIMGIPLYLMSQGFTSLTMGFFMLAVLLVVSARSFKRSNLLNEIIEAKEKRKISESGKPVRIR